MFSNSFLEFLVISLASLLITLFLFGKLSSYAEGKAKILGGSIKYGGALGGFLLIFLTLFTTYTKLSIENDQTDILLDGNWQMEMIKKDGSRRKGSATIHQVKGSSRLQIIGEIDSKTTPPSVSFSSLVGVTKERRLIFLYENSRNEMGIALGTIQNDNPQRLQLFYYDVLSHDTNKDFEGTIILTLLVDS